MRQPDSQTPVHRTRKATREERARNEAAQQAVVAAPPSPPVFATPGSPQTKRALVFRTPQTEAEQQTPTPTPSNSPAKMLVTLTSPVATTPVRGNTNSQTAPWTPGNFGGSTWVAGSPGSLSPYLGYGALRQKSPGYPSLPNTPGFRFDSPVRAQAQPDAYETASENLLNYIQGALGNENIDLAEMLRVVTNAKTSVSAALKTLPESSDTLAELYQEFIGKLGPFIGLISERQRREESLTQNDLISFLNTLSTSRQTVKVGI